MKNFVNTLDNAWVIEIGPLNGFKYPRPLKGSIVHICFFAAGEGDIFDCCVHPAKLFTEAPRTIDVILYINT